MAKSKKSTVGRPRLTPIEQWLKKPADYQAGVALYVKHGNSVNLKRILAAGPSEQNWAKLKYELGLIQHLA